MPIRPSKPPGWRLRRQRRALDALIPARRTVPLFRPPTPPAGLIHEALALACWAPNHHLTEPWRFYLLGPEARERIIALNSRLIEVTKGAGAAEKKRQRWQQMPGWLLVTSRRGRDEVEEEENFAACCCAMQNCALALWTRGIGMKWTTGAVARHPDFLPQLGVDPATERLVGLFWYGYPATVPKAQPRRPLSAVLTERP